MIFLSEHETSYHNPEYKRKCPALFTTQKGCFLSAVSLQERSSLLQAKYASSKKRKSGDNKDCVWWSFPYDKISI